MGQMAPLETVAQQVRGHFHRDQRHCLAWARSLGLSDLFVYKENCRFIQMKYEYVTTPDSEK